jgi:hypothetical protein
MSKSLSFAGRLQLLTSVLYSTQLYWSGIFMLPKKIILSIEQKFNRFLTGSGLVHAKGKVAWDSVCSKKKREAWS